MKVVLHTLLVSGGSIVLFIVATMGILSAQGRLNSSLLDSEPGEVTDDPKVGEGESNALSEDESGVEGKGNSSGEEKVLDKEEVPPDAFAELYRRSVRAFKLPSGFSAEELKELVEELQTALHATQENARGLEEDRAELLTMRQGLDLRWSDLESSLENLESLSEEVQVEKRRIHETVIILRENEQDSLKNLATIYEGMAADAVAKAVEQMDEVEAAKLLSTMNPRSAAEALSQMDAVRAATLSMRLKSMVQEAQLKPPE